MVRGKSKESRSGPRGEKQSPHLRRTLRAVLVADIARNNLNVILNRGLIEPAPGTGRAVAHEGTCARRPALPDAQPGGYR